MEIQLIQVTVYRLLYRVRKLLTRGNGLKEACGRVPQELRVLSRSKGKAKLAIFRLRLRLGRCCVEVHNGNVLIAQLLNGR